jgi:hypothetical protein
MRCHVAISKFVCVMSSRLSPSAIGGLRSLSALLLACVIFVSTEAFPISYRVKLLLGESENRLQGSSGSTPFSKSYSATTLTSAQSSNIIATLTPSTQSISFSNILITDISVDVTAAHIHGPCASASPCSDGALVYTICSPCPSKSAGNTVTIPGFTVDITQLNGNASTAVGLYQGVLYSNKLYYLNFHTAR